MNQSKHYLKILILPLFFVFSSNIAIFNFFIETEQEKKIKKIQQLGTVAAVNHEIDTMKNNILNEYLMELTVVTKLPYDDIQAYIHDKRTTIKKRLEKHKPQMHDPNIPSSMYKEIQAAISEENINPQSIRLEYKTGSHDRILAKTVDGDYSGMAPTIWIYEPLSQKSETDQIFIYHHELQHVLLMHTAITMNYYRTDLRNKKLPSIEEREADIHAASKNSQIAYNGMLRRCNIKHTQIINQENHCSEMGLMYELMKQKEKLAQKESL